MGGRPTRAIDYRVVRELAEIQCTEAEIAGVIGFTPEWLCKRKVKDAKLAEAIEQGRANGTASLRRTQHRLAQKGNVVMLIWLGKQRLGQREPERTIAAEVIAPVVNADGERKLTMSLTLTDTQEG
jgi:hypothetical protein